MSTENSVEQPTAEEEHRFHHYTGNMIPWYVRLIWVGFWVFAIYYAITYMLPTMQEELVSPP
ncbi:MAG: hypothetical protein AB8G99_16215 [Planctomycetaceae bacterium]